MKLLNTFIGLLFLLALFSCAKEGLWNQETEVQRGSVVGTLLSSEDGSALSGVKILFERQTRENGKNSFVDTVSTDANGKFSYEIPFPNKVRIVLRDTGRYMADTAVVEILDTKEYTVNLTSFPRFGIANIHTLVQNEKKVPMAGLQVALYVRESNFESYSAVDTMITDDKGNVSFPNIAFPVNYKVQITENPLAYDLDTLEGKLLTKDDLHLVLNTRAKFGKGTLKFQATNYHTLKALKNEKINIQTKSVFDTDFSASKVYQLDAEGKMAVSDFVYPSEIKITPITGAHPFETITIGIGETEFQNGVSVELKDLLPRYTNPVYTNLVVSTLNLSTTLSNPTGVTSDSKGNIYFADGSSNRLIKIDRSGEMKIIISGEAGTVDGPLSSARVNQIWGVIADKDDNLYFVDNGASGSSHKVRKITFDEAGNGVVSTIAGSGASGGTNGVGTAATFNRPAGLAIDNTAQLLYVSEWGGHRVRKIDLATKTVTTVVGTGSGVNSEGVGVNAGVFQPAIGIALSPDNKKLYIGSNASNSDGSSRIGVLDLATGAYK